MLKDQQMFKEMLKIFQFFELTSEVDRRNIRQMISFFLLFINCCIIIFNFLIISEAENIDDFTYAVLFLPTNFQNICNIIIVAIKKQHILNLIESMDDSVFGDDSEAKPFFKKAEKKIKILRSSSLVTSFVASFISLAAALITGKLAMPIWIPEAFKGTSKAFYVCWGLQVLTCFYFVFLTYAINNFPFCSLIVMENYAEFMRIKLKSIKKRSDIIACIEFHLKIKK